MDDLISRQDAIDDIWTVSPFVRLDRKWVDRWLRQLPSAEKESFEWCDTCKEYDQEAHCCHRWSKMIRKTVEEMKLIHCIDCRYSEYDSVYGERWCHYNGKAEVVDDYHFCSCAERRKDG